MPALTHLFLKKRTGAPMVPVSQAVARAGYGLEGDINANPISPRQLLVTRREDLDDLTIPYGGLRENIILEGIPAVDFQPGALLRLGAQVALRLTFHCEPCKIIAPIVPSLAAVRGKRGILGVVTQGGELHTGDTVQCTPGHFEPLSEIPYERFLDVMRQVPAGKVITYQMLTQRMGVVDGFARAIPKYIEKALKNAENVPLHRIVYAGGKVQPGLLANQAELLAGENIELVREPGLFSEMPVYQLSLDKYLWKG